MDSNLDFSIEKIRKLFETFQESTEFKKLIKRKKDNGLNVFNVVGMGKQEIRHSNFLAFLLSPKESHGFGNLFLRQFVERLLSYTNENIDSYAYKIKNNKTILNPEELFPNGIQKFFMEDANVTRESFFNIDILVVSMSQKTTITIENKIFSGVHSFQLSKYYERIEETYPTAGGWKNIYIYLTPFGTMPEEDNVYCENWCVFTHEQILMIVDNFLDNINNKTKRTDATNKIKILLEDYKTIMNTEILMRNQEIKKLCKEIHNKFPNVVEWLKAYETEENNGISEYIQTYLEKFSNDDSVIVLRDSSNRTFVRFVTKYITDILPEEQDIGYGFRNGRRFMYEIKIEAGGAYAFANTYKGGDAKCSELFRLSQNNSDKCHVRRQSKEYESNRIVNFGRLLEKDDVTNGLPEIQELLEKALFTLLTIEIPKFEKLLKENFKDIL